MYWRSTNNDGSEHLILVMWRIKNINFTKVQAARNDRVAACKGVKNMSARKQTIRNLDYARILYTGR